MRAKGIDDGADWLKRDRERRGRTLPVNANSRGECEDDNEGCRDTCHSSRGFYLFAGAARYRSASMTSPSATLVPRRAAPCPRMWPMRTITTSRPGTIQVFCPPAPAAKYVSFGRFQPPSPFTQNSPPYTGRFHAGAGVLTNFVQPSGRIRCPCHIPSCA